MATNKVYNKTEDYERIIQPIVSELIIECQKLGIPMFFSTAISNSNAMTEYKSEMVSPEMLDVSLTDDKITPMLLVLNGFTPTRGDVKPEIEEEFQM